MRALRVAVASLVCLPGCLSPPSLPPRPDTGVHDASLPAFALVGVEVTDGRGGSWPLDAVPRTPTIHVAFTSAPADPSLVLLVSGTTDGDLDGDLEASPYRATTLQRAIDVTRSTAGGTLTLVPDAPLVPGASVTVVVPGWLEDAEGHRLDASVTQTLAISTAVDAGARATDAWPPDGAFDVAPTLAFVAVRFDGTIEDATHAITFADARGTTVPSTAVLTSCAAIGWADGVCVQRVPLAPVAPSTELVVSVAASALDATGARIPTFEARFRTAADTPSALGWGALSCAIGEATDPAGCLRADDESIAFRGQLSGAARLAWTAGSVRGATITPRGSVSVRVGDLLTGTTLPFELDATDYAGRTTSLSLPLATTEPLATLSITEVRADPAGVEPRQEYVEIENYGALAVSLAGMHLADAPTAVGDALPDVSIPAGARALVVSAAFDPDDTAGARDVAVPAGALLVRVDASLASGGLSNTGEPLFLRDTLDRWVSAVPATPAPREGVCVVRASVSRRVGDAGSFRYDPALTCTPGR